jgi:hypothetical protein
MKYSPIVNPIDVCIFVIDLSFSCHAGNYRIRNVTNTCIYIRMQASTDDDLRTYDNYNKSREAIDLQSLCVY